MVAFPSVGDALAWLDSHQNMERMLASVAVGRSVPPDLGRMRAIMDLLGHPESACPAIHVTGTNGKTSTARCITSLLMAKGLRVGTFTSPHLVTVNERIAADGEPIDDASLAEVLSSLAGLEPLLADSLGSGVRLTWFELLTAAAFLWFADRPVDVAVLEVGMGGRWDATNVASASVAVVTNIGLDHVEFLGPTRADVAAEKAGVVKPGSVLVLGEADPSLTPIFQAEGPTTIWLAGRDYECARNDLTVGGRLLDVRTPAGYYPEVWLDLHGRHQGLNFAAALAGVEAFFGAPVEQKLVREAAASVSSPGRMEVVRGGPPGPGTAEDGPLVVLDGAKNLEGAEASAAAVAEEFGASHSVVMVVGMLRGAGKEPHQMLAALGVGGPLVRLVVACTAPSPRAVPAEEVVEAARSLGCPVVVAPGVPEALDLALASATARDVVLVTGSLYVVGAARSALANLL